MAMQCPILLPYGEDGYNLNILYQNITSGRGVKRKYVTMREYYAYRLQQRNGESKKLMNGGKLLQQYIVDAFACVEEQRLHYLKMNQSELRSEIYKGIQDAYLRGDVDGNGIGKRVILPSSFTGGPRYMIQNYQDAMAICRSCGHLDLFITFTCNSQWPEIKSALDLTSGQKTEDRPDIVSRVFKMKLYNFIFDNRKHHIT